MTPEDPDIDPSEPLPEPNLTEGQLSIGEAPAVRAQPAPQPPAPAPPAKAVVPACCWVAVLSSVCSVVLATLLWLRTPGPVAPAPVRAARPPAQTQAPPPAASGAPQALQPYLEAAEAGDVHAMRMLGAMYYHGLDLPRNRQEGLQWYRKAAASGSKVAQDELRQLE